MPTARWRRGAEFARRLLPMSLVDRASRPSALLAGPAPTASRARMAQWARAGQCVLGVSITFGSAILPGTAHAMHLAEGILPLPWAAFWTAVALPFVAVALRQYRRRTNDDIFYRPLVAMVAAAVFLISCMPIPVPTAGTCSHPCGTGLGAILIGPWLTILVTVVALLLQAVLLAHGGITTLGADVLSMGVAGAFVGYGVFHGLRRLGAAPWVAAFAAGLLSDWATYSVTALELASALHGARPFGELFVAVGLAFVPTQLPLGILEGLLSAGAVSFLYRRRRDILERLQVIPARLVGGTS
jgi:cobalt/nickel transport system permease protein